MTHSVSTETAGLAGGTYHLDPRHYSIVFDVDHLGFSRFTMRFDRAQATLDFHPADPVTSTVDVEMEAASIDTNVAELDAMIRDPSMLDADKSPIIRFQSHALRLTGRQTGEMDGTLTIRGRSAPVTLAVTFNGGGSNPLTRAPTLGFAATGSFRRSAVGLTNWFPAVGDDIHVVIQAEFEAAASPTTPAR